MSSLNILILWTYQSTYIESIVTGLILDDNNVTIIYSEKLSSYPELQDVHNLATRYFIGESDLPCEIFSKNWSIVFVAGWHKKYFRKFLRIRADVIRVMYTDTQDQKNLKFLIYGLLFKRLRRIYFDGGYVPGIRQLKFLERLGFSSESASIGGISFDDSTFQKSNYKLSSRNGPFLFVGRICYEKNLQNLCLAYDLYRQTSTNPRELQLVGPIENFVPLEQTGVHLMGFQSKREIASLLNSCRAFLFPSLFEPFGVALIEAAACGAPLLASNNVGAVEHLISANNGFIVNPNDVEEISRRMLEFDEWNEIVLQDASDTSEALAEYFSPKRWVIRFKNLSTQIQHQKGYLEKEPNSILFFLSVIPKYRREVVDRLKEVFDQKISFQTTKSSSDGLVVTDDTLRGIGRGRILNFYNILFVQIGNWRKTLHSDCLILDLNPRNLKIGRAHV